MNDDRTLTKHSGERLAAFLRTLRNDWDEPGIVTALSKARHRGTAADVAIAAIRCAGDPANRTPAVIALDGRHWRPPVEAELVTGTPQPAAVRICSTCGSYVTEDDHEEHCARRATADAYQSGAAQARAALHRARHTEEETA